MLDTSYTLDFTNKTITLHFTNKETDPEQLDIELHSLAQLCEFKNSVDEVAKQITSKIHNDWLVMFMEEL